MHIKKTNVNTQETQNTIALYAVMWPQTRATCRFSPERELWFAPCSKFNPSRDPKGKFYPSREIKRKIQPKHKKTKGKFKQGN